MGNSGKKRIVIPQRHIFKKQVLIMDTFLWAYDYSLDEKGRLSIPAKYRKVMALLEETTIIISTLEGPCLTLYPYSIFKERIAKRIEELPQMDDDANEIRRRLYMSTTDATIDSHGRITLPASICQHATIEKAVKIIGLGSKIEVWNPEVYQKEMEKPDAKSIKEELKKFRI